MAEVQAGDFKTLLKRLIRRDTKTFKKILDGDDDALSKLSEKARSAYTEIAKRDFGVAKEHLTALVGAFLGESLPPVKKEGGWIFNDCGAIAVKMITQPDIANNGEFKVGALLARLPGYKFDGRTCYNEAFISQRGDPTNQAMFARQHFEFATDEEVDKYVDSLPEAAITTAKKGITILTAEDK